MVGKDRQSLYLISFRAESLVPFYRWQRQNTRPRCFNQKLVEGIFFSRFWASSMASSRANHPPLSPISSHREIFPRIFFLPALSPPSSLSSATILRRLFRVVITTKYFRKSNPLRPIPSYYFSKKGFTCIHIYTRLYLCIDVGERGCVYACTKGKVVEQFPQLLPLPHKRFLSSVDIDVRRFAGALASSFDIPPSPPPLIFSRILFFLFFFLFFIIVLILIPRFISDEVFSRCYENILIILRRGTPALFRCSPIIHR